MTQVLFDLSCLESFLERIGGSPIPLLVGVWPIARSSSPCGCTTRRRESSYPNTSSAATATRGRTQRDVGVDLVRELVAEARTLAAGVYVVAPFRRPLGVLDLLATL